MWRAQRLLETSIRTYRNSQVEAVDEALRLMRLHEAKMLKEQPSQHFARTSRTFEKLASYVIKHIAGDLLRNRQIELCYQRATELKARLQERKQRVKTSTQFEANLVLQSALALFELHTLTDSRDIDGALGRILSLKTRWARLQEMVHVVPIDIKPVVLRALDDLLSSHREAAKHLARTARNHWENERPASPEF